MEITNDLKLFIVEFVEPEVGNFIRFNSGDMKPLFVLAKNFNQAAKKALDYAESLAEIKGLVDGDGSLRQGSGDLQIKSVKIAANEIVF